MSASSTGAKGFKGDDIEFKLVIKENEGKTCYDLSNVTAAELKMPGESGTITLNLVSGLTIPTPINGEIVVNITDTISSTLKTGSLNLELVLDESGEFKTLQFDKGLTITARLY